MPLFHPRVIAKHTKNAKALPLYHAEILNKWADNLAKGMFDRETSHDSEFIQRILVDVLGYIGSSAGIKYTIAKNHPVGRGNVDVALGHFSLGISQIIAPFELKGAKTRDLDANMTDRNKSPVQQAWEYAMDAKGAKWVLVSNYREIRLYAVGYGRKDYETFNLSHLSDPIQYARFMLLLSAENLLGEMTFSLLEESGQIEKEVTNNLYQDYKSLRVELINTLTQKNPEVLPLEIIQHSQTILDRILFVAFAEDKGLLPKETLKRAYEAQNLFNPQPVWDNFKGLFNAIDKGNPPLNIPGYNGGLFASNAQLNSLKLSDIQCEGFKKIGDYDFDSEVSVNILGHIFEQSITDLEEIKASLDPNTASTNKKKSKRKKDGIFYTPPSITHYIVEQAVGRWLNDRKKEIGFDKLPKLTEADYASIKIVKGAVRYNKQIEQHIEAFEAYKTVLSNIKVLDPACGSGAFLTEAFDYIYQQGQIVNSELTTLNGGQEQLFRWDTHILANNLYGVDINRESVEITKLSLWLKTANRNEKLTYLDDNIKYGNSLIDDPNIAGVLAFQWEKEFAEIMNGGGFDVVVGNPPYGAMLSISEKKLFKNVFHYVHMRVQDTFNYFIARGIGLLKESGYISYIVSNNLLFQLEYEKSRRYLLENYNFCIAVNLGDGVFAAADVPSCIFVVKKLKMKDYDISFIDSRKNKNPMSLDQNAVNIMKVRNVLSNPSAIIGISNQASQIYSKVLQTDQVLLNDLCNDISYGVCTGGDKVFRLSMQDIIAKNIESNLLQSVIVGGEIKRYLIEPTNHFLIYTTKNLDLEHYPNTLRHLLPHKSKLETKRETEKGILPWWGLWWPRSKELFNGIKIILRQTGDRIIATLDRNNNFTLDSVMIIKLLSNDEENALFVLSLLNSKLFNFLYSALSQETGRVFAQVKPQNIRKLPIRRLPANQQRLFVEKAEIMLAKNKELHDISSKFLDLLKSEFKIKNLGDKLQQWYTLDFASFVEELEKKKSRLTLEKKAEWIEYFKKQKARASDFKAAIDQTDNDIDRLVYQAYGLTSEEIAIIEGDSL